MWAVLGRECVGCPGGGDRAAVDLVDSWLDRARDTAQAADDYVREQPWSALAVVALLGLAAGFLLSRAARR